MILKSTRKRYTSLIVWGAVAAILLVYAVFDPLQAGWMPRCPFNFFTGLSCPGCGSQRALHAVLHGDFAGAFHANAFLMVMIPFIALVAYAEITKKKHPRLYGVVSSWPVILTLLVLMVGWTIYRNLPLLPHGHFN